jgi:glycosyltransferase involved in cell wall biosynthesis
LIMAQRVDPTRQVRVYIQSPPWFIRPRNTDWRYTRFSVPRIAMFEPTCSFYPARSQRTALECNWRCLRNMLVHKLSPSMAEKRGSLIDREEFARSGCQLVFCHDDFPNNADGIAVVWQSSILDPEMERARGMTDEQLIAVKTEKGTAFRQARFVQVATKAESVRLGKWFPDIAEKFVAVPFFLPGVRGIEETQLEEKLAHDGPLRCIFVGHEARRKGLARVYDAFAALPAALQQRIELTVISRQSDGRIPAPALPNLTVHGALPFAETQQLILRSDVFVMPSLYESFGLVFLEAMALGTIPIVPNWEVQREIVDNGNAGLVASGESRDLAFTLERLSEDRDFRVALARSAWQRFQSHFSPQIVARKYCDLFCRAAQE